MSDTLGALTRGAPVSHLIYVCGANRSGTTLIKRMFHAAEGVSVIPGETHHWAIAEHMNGGTVVLKGAPIAWLRYGPYQEGGRREAVLNAAERVTVLFMTRDVRSWGARTDRTAKYWLAVAQEAQRWASDIDIMLPFELLVRDPEQAQERLKIGLTWKASFSDYPSFLPESEDFRKRDFLHRGHRVRPLESEIAENRLTLDDITRKGAVSRDALESALTFYGYEV